MSKFFNPEEVEILSQKGTFPYEWFDSFDKLYETEFPPHEAFRSKLSGWDEKTRKCKNIKKEDYDFGQSVYKRFCKESASEPGRSPCVMDYHDLYLKIDVLLLADVCQAFSNTCREKFGLDPFRYYTSPGFAWV